MKLSSAFLKLVCCLLVMGSAKAQISGTVYRDYNGNGSRQTVFPSIELGVGGVTVNAYDANDVLVASTTSTLTGASVGNYSFTGLSFPLRIEFIVPTGTGCVSASHDFSSFSGDGNNVRFVSAATATLNYGINNPADYVASTNPFVYAPRYINGDPLGGGSAGTSTWFVGYPYNNSGNTSPTLTLDGTVIGATWGVAYSRQAKKVFTSAFIKRHCGLGQLGSGGIYMLTPTSNSFAVNQFFDMDAPASLVLGSGRTRAAAGAPAYGEGSSYTLSAGGEAVSYSGAIDAASGQPEGLGVIGTNIERGLPNNRTANFDPAAFDQVGKAGLGGLSISDDGQYLFVMNLYDKKLYRLQLDNPYNPSSVIAVTSYSLPAVAVSNGVLRPFASKYYRGKLYVGAVSTGENGGVNNVGGSTDMNAYVFELNDPAGTASYTSSPVLSYPLNYLKGASRIDQTGVDRGEKWNPWTNNSASYLPLNSSYGTYPTPILSGLEFSDRGDLIMAFNDRSGNQWGWENRKNLSTSSSNVNFIVGGDLLIASESCSSGNFSLESNGSISSFGQIFSSAGGGVANSQGPGGGEFFDQEFITPYHDEIQMGSAVVLPGQDRVLTSTMDPLVINTGGSVKFSTSDGSQFDAYEIYGAAGGEFGKANGLGDIELAGEEPPIEIGNSVWNDSNGDGIQNAGEDGIAGITLELLDALGNPVDSDPLTAGVQPTFVTTDANGNWYISSATGTDAVGINYGVALQPSTNYLIRLATGAGDDWDPAANGGAGGPKSGQQLDGLLLTKKDEIGNGAVDLSDNDAAIVNSIPEISITTGAYGQNNHSIDFGFVPLAKLGDKVWRDDNKDGVQDSGEPGISGISVTLFDNTGAVAGSTITDAYGNYLFNRLEPGNYTVGFTLPANYTFSTQTNTADNTDGIATKSTGSDVNIVSGITYIITLSAGERELNVDAGLVFNTPAAVATVGDRVWLDINDDGIQDITEPGVAGVTVTLYFSGFKVASTVTDANGNYLFTDVTPASGYTVGFSLPPSMVFASKDQGGNDNTDSDVNPVPGAANFGQTDAFTVSAGTANLSLDAGIKPQPSTTASIGDRVWNDLNRDGIQDAGEPGLAGVLVRLLDGSRNPVLVAGNPVTAITDAFGYYNFNDLLPGSYFIEFVKPAGYEISPLLQGTDIAVDNNAIPATGSTFIITVIAGDRINTYDAGMYNNNFALNSTATLGDKVWRDDNKDGVQDAGEPGVAGITVALLDGLGNPVLSGGLPVTTTTSADGNYLFTDLAPGTYRVLFTNLPSGFVFASADLGGDDTKDSDVNTLTGITSAVTIAAGQSYTDLDAGIKRGVPAGKGSLGNSVWYDLDNDGLKDDGELGVPGITVTLYSPGPDGVIGGGDDIALASTTTDALGEYMFGGLNAGLYYVAFSNLPAGFIPSPSNAGTDDTIDSDGGPLSGGVSVTGVYNLTQGEDILTIDLGLNKTGTNSLGDFVWFDVNNDGIQDATEPGVPGVMVVLLDGSGTPVDADLLTVGIQLVTTTTDANGKYLFAGLADGTYNVAFLNLPSGFSFTTQSPANTNDGSDADAVTGKTSAGVILNFAAGGASRDNSSLDAGLQSTRGILGNFVWNDLDGNGIQDPGEPGIAGVTVTLYAADGTTVISSAITDKNGHYLFANLNPGSYVLGFSTLPGNMSFTTNDASAENLGTDSDADPVTGKTAVITLVAGEVNLGADAGLRTVIPASVGNYVWIDTNINGLQDANEPGVGGIIVTLYSAAGNVVGAAVTDGKGAYQITNVIPGNGYYVVFSNLPTAAVFTTQTSDVTPGDATLGSDANTATGTTASFNLSNGQYLSTVDAGLIWVPSGVLTVALLNFSAEKNESATSLKWSTSQEINSSFMEVERSADGIHFTTTVGRVTAAGNSTGTRNYSLNDVTPAFGKNYYRLKLVSTDGRIQYSQVMLVRFDKLNSIAIYPNPARDKINIVLPDSWAGKAVNINLYDLSGKLVITRLSVHAAQTELVDVSSLPNGVYVLKLQHSGNVIEYKKIQVIK